ncbi:MAG: hypothetical protein E7317_02455 [Clostridiales bacterium]|nr:hypothetical protein [Clostridiales bacterium]
MKKVQIKSAVPIWLAAAVWLLVGLIAPKLFLRLPTLLVPVVLSAGVYFGASQIFKGKTVMVEEKVDTGDPKVDQQITDGRARLENLGHLNDQLPDPEISKQLDRMKTAGDAILGVLEKDPSHYNEVRRFMNYFLPTAEKLVDSYAQLSKIPTKGENVRSAMTTVETSLGKIADAFEKQLDSLFRDQSFDIEADVKVLETMLKSDGLIDSVTLQSVAQGQ